MRKVILGSFVSVDGIMQAPGGPEEDASGGFKYGGWVFPFWDETTDQAVEHSLSWPYDLLLGRKTYDIFASYWPHQEDGPNAKIAKEFNAATKYVATSSAAPLAWRNSAALRDPAQEVARLKQEDGPNLVIQGSSVLVHTLLAHDLIDEITLMVFPVFLGQGKRLFGEDAAGALKLVSSRASASGVTINTYTRAGPVPTGSFVADAPS
ncbi:MAG: dihydrofolate reductase [Hyphomonadaceae bacterium]|nr:dihydrofolate reductase [Hyphomonadaceae bacterium]